MYAYIYINVHMYTDTFTNIYSVNCGVQVNLAHKSTSVFLAKNSM